MPDGKRQDAQHDLERLCRDLGLSPGDHANARAVARPLERFTLASDLSERQFYAIAILVQRCVYRALNADTGRSGLEIEQRIRRAIAADDAGPTADLRSAGDGSDESLKTW